MFNEKYIFFNLDSYLLMLHGAPWPLAFSVEISGLLGLIIILIFALLTKKSWGKKGYASQIFGMVLVVFCLMILSLLLSEFLWYRSGLSQDHPFYPLAHFVSSPMLAFFKLFLLLLTCICLIVYRPFFACENGKWEYGILLLIITLAMLVLISTVDLVVAFIAIEIQTLTLYVMLGLKRYSNLSMEAAQKFFFFAGFSSCCLGAGIGILYGYGCETNIYHLGVFFDSQFSQDISFIAVLGGLLILVGLLFKLALIPFHFWVGDIFQGTFGYFNSYLAIVSKLPVVLFLAKVLWWMLFTISPYFAILLKFVGLISLIIGSVYAFTEINFKRFWALSAIVNMGLIIFALSYGTCTGLAVCLSYMFFYLLNSVFLWIIAIHLVKNPDSSFAFNEFLTKIIKFTSLSQNKLYLAVFISLVLFSLAGLPPATGFLPKAWLFLHLYVSNDLALLFAVFLFSFLSMAYYIRLARFLLFPLSHPREWESFKRLSPTYTYVLILIFFLNLFVLIFFFSFSSVLLNTCFVFLTVV